MTGETEKAQHTDNSVSDDESDEEPYDEFMRRHLQQYGFCTDLLHDHCIPRSTQIVFEYHSGRRVPRLRKPRDLYGVSSSDSEQLSRWPFECEVLKEKIHHINWVPSVPEPLYKPTGLEKEPVCMDATYGTVVYEMDGANKEPYFICSRVGGCRGPLKRVAVNISDMEDTTLIFESRFESGNLQKAVKVGEYDYELTLRNDYYTNKHTQWYYFRVSNTRPDVTYRFTIINFLKPSSLYNLGMRPLMYSELEAHTRQVGWHRIGDEIKYYRNNLMQDGQQYYSLTWTFQFPHKNDTCYFAHCYPYTYRDLQDYLIRLANDPWKSQFCKIRVLCHSLAGNMVYVLTITNPSQSRDEAQHKKAVVLTARVHPGESNSSWIMKGFLDYILGNSADATVLRDAFIFKVVPMLNPDGVIVGNYRCSLTGRDLNRNYKTILKESFPSVWYTRNMVKLLLQEREVILYCDFHGHSRKQNVFVYGCGECLPSPLKHRAQVFPFMLSRNCQDKFSFSDCKFKVQKSKEGTGRVVMWKLGVSNSYTMEASFCGSVIGRRKDTHFSTEDFESLSYCLCDTLLDYCDPDRTKYIQCLKEVEEITKQHINLNTEIPEDNDTLPISDVSDAESSINGSNSSESDGLPVHLLEMASKGDEAGRPCGKKRASLRGHGDHILGENLGEKQMTQNQYDNGSAMQRLEYGRKNSLPISEEKQMICDRVPGKVSVVYLILDSRGSVIPAKSSCLEAVSAAYAQNGMLVEKSTAKDKLPELSTMSALHLKNHYRLPPFCVKKAHMNISKCASDSAVSMHRHNTSGLSLQNIPDVAKQKILQNPVEVSAFHNIVRDLTNRRKKILSSEDMMNKRTKQKKLQNKKQKKTISVSASRTKSIETNASEFRLSPESLDRVYHNRCSRVGSGSLSTAPLHSESGLTGTTHRVLSGSFINRKTRRGLRRESRALSAC